MTPDEKFDLDKQLRIAERNRRLFERAIDDRPSILLMLSAFMALVSILSLAFGLLIK